MNLPNPLLKIFRTKEGVYVYSGHTNIILRITEAQLDILKYYGRKSKDEIIEKLKKKHDIASLKEGYNNIDILNKENNLFTKETLKTRGKKKTIEDMKKDVSRRIWNMTLEVTEECNFRCKYCVYSGGYNDQRPHSHKDMSFSTAKAAIDFMHKRHLEVKDKEKGDKVYEHEKELVENFTGLGFYGGEPLLRFDFMKKCIDYFNSLDWGDKRPYHHFTTNGSLLTEDIIDYLIEHKVRPLISLDGPKSEHDRNRIFKKNGNGSFDVVFSNVKALMDKLQKREEKNKSYFNPGIACVISPSADLMAIKDFFSDMANAVKTNFGLSLSGVTSGNFRYFKENPYHPERQKHTQSLYKEYADAVTSGKDMQSPENIFLEKYVGKQFIGFVKGIHKDKAEDHVYSLSMCDPPFRKPYVTVDGKIHICERLNPHVSIGDVWKGLDVEKLTNYWNDYATLLDKEDCLNCWAVSKCKICFSQLLDRDRFSEKMKLSQCEGIRNDLLRQLTFFCAVREKRADAFEYLDEYSVG